MRQTAVIGRFSCHYLVIRFISNCPPCPLANMLAKYFPSFNLFNSKVGGQSEWNALQSWITSISFGIPTCFVSVTVVAVLPNGINKNPCSFLVPRVIVNGLNFPVPVSHST